MAKDKSKLTTRRKNPEVGTPTARAAEPRGATVAHDFVSAGETNPLGGATREELEVVVDEQLGADSDLEGSEASIALKYLSRIVGERMANTDWANDPKHLSVFIVSDRVRELAASLAATREPIIDNGSRILTGKLWLTVPNFTSGYFCPFTSSEPGGVFEEVRSKGLGGCPALVFDPTATEVEIRYYPSGVDDDSRVQRFPLLRSPYSLDFLDEAMKSLYEQSLVTPDAAFQFNPWQNGAKYIPKKSTESLFQGMLKVLLGVVFGSKFRVAFEFPGEEGRCDLLIMSRSGESDWRFHVVMELKVLRSFTSGAHPVATASWADALAKGLLQAIAYKKGKKAKDGLLCCYDMRTPTQYDGLGCFEPIKAKARRAKIGIRQFRLFGTSEDFRQATCGGGSPSS